MFDRDTTPEARAVQARVLRSLSGAQKLEAMDALSRMTHILVQAGIRERFPEASESELEAEYFRVVLGSELATKVLEYRNRIRPKSSASERP